MFVTFYFGILGQLWYLIVSIPDLCHLSYFDHAKVFDLLCIFAVVFYGIGNLCKRHQRNVYGDWDFLADIQRRFGSTFLNK